MPEHSRESHPHPDAEGEREQSTDLGYRDTEEERAYEQAADEEQRGEAPGAQEPPGRR